MGRPSKYSPKLADEICERIADGESLKSICNDEHMPNKATVFRWLSDEAFRDKYERARDAQADALADEIVDIADGDGEESDPQRDRLRVDARKWVAAKLKPKKYGDKSLIGSDPDNPLPAAVTINFRKTDASDEHRTS